LKQYVLTGKLNEIIADQILTSIDRNEEFKIICGRNIDFDTANQIAAFGQPIFVRGELWDDDLIQTIENLLINSPECVIVEVIINKYTTKRVYEIVTDLYENKNISKAKLMLRELPINLEMATTIEWNCLIVNALDHGIDICWDETKGASKERYDAYLSDIA
jgi:hypothetical protein